MGIELGTRSKQNFHNNHPPGSAMFKSLTRDVGMSKLANAAMTFIASSGEVTAANGTFAAFAVNDPLLVEGTNLNNGYFTVIGIDSANRAFLTLDPSPKNEGPVTATMRTS